MPSLSRRDFLAASAGMPLASAASRRTNIVVILADDLGFSDISPYGGEIATPNLEKLARGGIRFSQFYNCARCCPTRSALLTGLYNHQAGVGHMVVDRGVPAYQGYLNERCVTIAEALKPAGYQTLMSGKWHVGEERPHWPTDRGFDQYFGLISGASNYYRLDPGRKMALNDQPFVPDDPKFYMTDAITDHAVRMVRGASSKPDPFFLYLAYTAPHWPLHAPPEEIAKYRGKYRKGWDRLREERHERQLAMGLIDKRWKMSPRNPEVPAWDTITNQDEWDLRMAVYAAQVDRLDQGIGRVLDAVRASGQWDDTLVLFLADNGGCAEEIVGSEKTAANPVPGGADSFTSYRRPWANASNTPFRYWKQMVHEGGISSPLIAHWPKGIRARNQVTPQPGHVIDIMATCLDVAGAKYPANPNLQPVEGLSLKPALEGKNRKPHHEIGWEHQGHRAFRAGDWKLVSRFRGPWELYNLRDDRTETTDLAPKEPDRVKSLETAWTQWASRCGVEPWEKINPRA